LFAFHGAHAFHAVGTLFPPWHSPGMKTYVARVTIYDGPKGDASAVNMMSVQAESREAAQKALESTIPNSWAEIVEEKADES